MPRPLGAPNLRDVEIDAMIRGVKKRLPRVQAGELGMMRLYELVGEETGFDAKTVSRVWRMMQPTTGLAIDFIRARAFRMARRVVNEGSVDALINILERPNVGVLDPVKKVESGGGGFFISVQADSCGAVNVGVMPQQSMEARPDLPALPAPEESIIDMAPGYGEEGPPLNRQQRDELVDPDARHRPRGPGGSKAYQTALEDMKARLAKRAKYNKQYAKRQAKKQAEKPLDNPQNSL